MADLWLMDQRIYFQFPFDWQRITWSHDPLAVNYCIIIINKIENI